MKALDELIPKYGVVKSSEVVAKRNFRDDVDGQGLAHGINIYRHRRRIHYRLCPLQQLVHLILHHRRQLLDPRRRKRRTQYLPSNPMPSRIRIPNRRIRKRDKLVKMRVLGELGTDFCHLEENLGVVDVELVGADANDFAMETVLALELENEAAFVVVVPVPFVPGWGDGGDQRARVAGKRMEEHIVDGTC